MANAVFIRRYGPKSGVSLIIRESWQLCSRLSCDHWFISKRLLGTKKKNQFDERKQDWLVQKFGLRAEHQLLLLTQEIKRRLCSQGVTCGAQSQLTVKGQGISGCTLWTVPPFGFFLIEEGKRKLLPEFCQNFEVTTAQTAGQDNLVSICLVINSIRYTKGKAIRPGFKNVS